jgi:hypothetical protein
MMTNLVSEVQEGINKHNIPTDNNEWMSDFFIKSHSFNIGNINTCWMVTICQK